MSHFYIGTKGNRIDVHYAHFDTMDLEDDASATSSNASGDNFENEPFEKPDFNPEEWELVEEEHCLLELHGITRKNFLQTCDKDRVKLIGLFDPEGETFLQLDQYIFVGKPSETFGTNVVFEETTTEGSSSDEDTYKNTPPEARQDVNLRYVTHTDKKISLYRALLSEKHQSSES